MSLPAPILTEQRKAKAIEALRVYETETERPCALVDLLTDTMHLVGEEVFARCLTESRMHYLGETSAD